MPLLMKEPVAGPLPAETEIVVGPDQAGAVVARRGQLLTVTDVEGRQPAALFGITLADPRVFLSPHHTRVFSNSFMLRLGMRLVTNRRRAILVLGKDTVGHQRSPASRGRQRLSRTPRTSRTRRCGGERRAGIRRRRRRAAEAPRPGQSLPQRRPRDGRIDRPRSAAVPGGRPRDISRRHRRNLRCGHDCEGCRSLGRGTVDAARGARAQLAGLTLRTPRAQARLGDAAHPPPRTEPYTAGAGPAVEHAVAGHLRAGRERWIPPHRDRHRGGCVDLELYPARGCRGTPYRRPAARSMHRSPGRRWCARPARATPAASHRCSRWCRSPRRRR